MWFFTLQPHFAEAKHPVWSPDGSHLLFVGRGTAKPTSPSEELHYDWWVAPLDGGPAIGTGTVDAFARHRIAGRPDAWLADGNRVLFAASAGPLLGSASLARHQGSARVFQFLSFRGPNP